MMGLEFSKYHGSGNDFILVYEGQVGARQAASLCDRHLGVGADGVILIGPSEVADFRFTLFNADGSEAEVSGNGLRCVGRFLRDRGIASGDAIKVEASGEVKVIEFAGDLVKVDMGIPREEGEIELAGSMWSKVDVGNPHAVGIFVDVSSVDIDSLGPRIERDEAFPRRTNVDFIEVSSDRIKARFWERGVGVTLACGTGSVAALVASGLDRAVVENPGGELIAERHGDGRVYLSGDAVHVFDGRLA